MFYLVKNFDWETTNGFYFVLLDDDTRVCLKRGSNDYINANYVQVPAANRRYILTQVNLLGNRF
jgi:protein tyrosine phosphatase